MAASLLWFYNPFPRDSSGYSYHAAHPALPLLSFMKIRSATEQEAPLLSQLAMRSKAHWGYDAAFMESCRDELTYTAIDVRSHRPTVIETQGSIAGFYLLHPLADQDIELEAMFVDPPFIGRGCGRALLQAAVAEATDRGFQRLVIQADPNAATFYQAAGAVWIGERDSASVPGRKLPLFQVGLSP